MFRKTLLTAAFLGLLALGFYYLLDRGDMRRLVELSAGLDARGLLLLLALNVAVLIVNAIRFGEILAANRHEISLGELLRVTLVAAAAGYAAVGKLSAPLKALSLKGAHRLPLSRSVPAILIEQVLDLSAMAGVIALALALSGPLLGGVLKNLGVEAPWAAGTLIGALLAATLGAATLLYLVRSNAWLQSALQTFRGFAERRGTFATAAGWTAVIHGVGIAAVATVLWILELRMDSGLVLMLASLPVVAGLVSPVPGGLGVREYVFGAVYGLCCGDAAAAVLAATLLRLAFFLALPTAFLILLLLGAARRIR